MLKEKHKHQHQHEHKNKHRSTSRGSSRGAKGKRIICFRLPFLCLLYFRYFCCFACFSFHFLFTFLFFFLHTVFICSQSESTCCTHCPPDRCMMNTRTHAHAYSYIFKRTFTHTHWRKSVELEAFCLKLIWHGLKKK